LVPGTWAVAFRRFTNVTDPESPTSVTAPELTNLADLEAAPAAEPAAFLWGAPPIPVYRS